MRSFSKMKIQYLKNTTFQNLNSNSYMESNIHEMLAHEMSRFGKLLTYVILFITQANCVKFITTKTDTKYQTVNYNQ